MYIILDTAFGLSKYTQVLEFAKGMGEGPVKIERQSNPNKSGDKTPPFLLPGAARRDAQRICCFYTIYR
jgi:hypothetical protein